MKKLLRVTCGVISQDGKFLIVQHGHASKNALKWEFPGGKIEYGETEEQCIERELKEELNIQIKVLKRMNPVVCEEAEYIIELIPFHCCIISGKITLLEHIKMAWIDLQKPIKYMLCDADFIILDQLKNLQ
ncbi:MAG: (deoxy)nucleoside triphosphate pyrophosphohydrolase [Saprospiraceae bacterium]|nr:(deoxy)nucleoside triphosphate pyrophosphohydrolase [Saprospiraceae bacterium]